MVGQGVRRAKPVGGSYHALSITERTFPQCFWAPDSPQVDRSDILLWIQSHDPDLLYIHRMQWLVIDLTAGVVIRKQLVMLWRMHRFLKVNLRSDPRPGWGLNLVPEMRKEYGRENEIGTSVEARAGSSGIFVLFKWFWGVTTTRINYVC